MSGVRQRIEAEGKEPEHTPPATQHGHDHWHVGRRHPREDDERGHVNEAHAHAAPAAPPTRRIEEVSKAQARTDQHH